MRGFGGGDVVNAFQGSTSPRPFVAPVLWSADQHRAWPG